MQKELNISNSDKPHSGAMSEFSSFNIAENENLKCHRRCSTVIITIRKRSVF